MTDNNPVFLQHDLTHRTAMTSLPSVRDLIGPYESRVLNMLATYEILGDIVLDIARPFAGREASAFLTGASKSNAIVLRIQADNPTIVRDIRVTSPSMSGGRKKKKYLLAHDDKRGILQIPDSALLPVLLKMLGHALACKIETAQKNVQDILVTQIESGAAEAVGRLHKDAADPILERCVAEWTGFLLEIPSNSGIEPILTRVQQYFADHPDNLPHIVWCLTTREATRHELKPGLADYISQPWTSLELRRKDGEKEKYCTILVTTRQGSGPVIIDEEMMNSGLQKLVLHVSLDRQAQATVLNRLWLSLPPIGMTIKNQISCHPAAPDGW